MTDEQIEQLAYKHSCCGDEPLFEFGRRDLFAFANSLLSASIADTAGAKPVALNFEQINSVIDSMQHAPYGIGSRRKDAVTFAEAVLHAAPPAPSVADAAGAIGT